MTDQILIAACLMLVFEGLLPFVSPSQWRQVMLQIAAMPDEKIRMVGLASMMCGATLIYFIN